MQELKGIRVVELSSGVAVSVAGMLLSDLGADVVTLEPPEGDFLRRRPGYPLLARGKRSVVVHTEQVRKQWIDSADICIINSSISDEDEMLARNGGLIVLVMPPYLDGACPWSPPIESARLLSAYGGLALLQSSFDGGPVEHVNPFPLYVHGLLATVCAVAALVERGHTSKGQVVRVGGLQALFQSMISPLSANPAVRSTKASHGVAGRHPTYRPFLTKDGVWIVSGALGPRFETVLLESIGLRSLLEDERISGDTSRMLLPQNIDWCIDAIETGFAQREAVDLLDTMRSVGVPCGRVQERDNLLDHEQMISIGMVAAVNDPENGEVTMPTMPLNIAGSRQNVRPAPSRGEHSAHKPWSKREPRRTQADHPHRSRSHSNAPLSGYRVLNFGSFVATPYAGSLLSQLGVDVIKVEPMVGDPLRASTYTYNRGMKSLAIDLTDERCLEAIQKIIGTSDAIIDGLRPGSMKRLGLAFEDVQRIHSNLSYVSLSGYGEVGPLAGEAGVDMVIQGVSGMMRAQGGAHQPVANTLAINDTTAALFCVLGIVLGFYRKVLQRPPARMWTSLLGVSAFLQCEDLVRYPKRPRPQRGAPDYRGTDPSNGYQPSEGGWVASETHGDASIQVPARRVDQVLNDPGLLEMGIIRHQLDADGNPMAYPSRFIDMPGIRLSESNVPPGVGEHSLDLLRSAGIHSDVISQLVQDGVARAGGKIEHRLPTPYR